MCLLIFLFLFFLLFFLYQKGCACSFLFGPDTSDVLKKQIEQSLDSKAELKQEVCFYKSNGAPFWCLLDIVPIKNEKHEVVLFLASHKDVSKSRMAESEQDHQEDDDEDDESNALGPEGCLASANYQRRRSRAVLYQLSGHYRRSLTVKSKHNVSGVAWIIYMVTWWKES